MNKCARSATIAWRLGQRPLPNDIACKALDYLSASELPGLYVSSKGMRDLVTFYMEQRCEAVQFGGPGYTESWEPAPPGIFVTAHSVCRLAKRVRVLNVHTGKKAHLLVRLLRANAATLQSFSASAYVHPSAFVALASCHGLTALKVYSVPGHHPNLWKTAALVLAKSIRNLRTLHWSTFPHSQWDETSILLGHNPPPLQELVTQRLADYSVLCHSNLSQLRALEVGDVLRPSATQLASLARGIASLPALETLECSFRQVPALVNLRTEQPSWNLPSLTRLNINYPLLYLPRLSAPALTRLQAPVAPADLPDLMESCPLLQEGYPPSSAVLLEGSAAVAPANLSAYILANSGWRESLTHLTVQPPGLHPAAVAAIASRWHKLTCLSFFLRRGASPLVVRMLLESLPVLRALTVRSHPVGEEEAAAVSAFRPQFSPSEKEVPALSDLSLSIADDALFAGLSFPSLKTLTLRTAQATVTNIFAVLPRMPCLNHLELEDNAAVGAAPSTGYLHPSELALSIRQCVSFGPETLSAILDAIPLLATLGVSDCPRLRAEEVLLLLSGYERWESLSAVVVRTHGSQPLPPLDDEYATLVGIFLEACPDLTLLLVEESRQGWTALPSRLVSHLRRHVAINGLSTEMFSSFGTLHWDLEEGEGDE